MTSNNKDTHQNWRELCAEAAKEHDPEKLRELVRKINEALAPKTRGSIRQYEEDILSSRVNPELGAIAVRTGWSQMFVPNLRLTSRALGRFSAWRSRVKVEAGSICAPLRTIH